MIITVLILFLFLFIWGNEAYKRTNHYTNRFFRVSHLMKIREDEKFDVINLGSSQPFFGFDYSTLKKLRGYNLAVYPQYFEVDYAILQQFASHVKKGGTVIICICLLNFFLGGGVMLDLTTPYLGKI